MEVAAPRSLILIVDDELANCKLLAALLEHEGYATLSATSGEAALASVALHVPDLILLDVVMPGMDGFQVAAALKANVATSRVPIIMVTQRLDHEAQLAGLNAGAEEFLTKPVDRAELWLRVRNLLRLKAFSDILQGHGARLEQQVQARNRSLVESESLKSAMLAASLDSIVTIDHEGRIVEFNPAAEIAFGIARARALGSIMVDLIVPHRLRDAHRRGFARYLATGNGPVLGKRLELHALRADGSEFPIELTITAMGQAASPMFTAFVRDISVQLAARTRLRESEARFRSLTMLSSDWFWEQDENHRFVRFSGGDGVKGWGPDQNQAVGLHRWDLGGAIPVSGSWEQHQAVLDAHLPFRKFEYQRILGDGRLQYVEASGEPVFDASGRFTGYRGVAAEITERKRAERELKRFRAAMDSSGDGIVLIDRASMKYVDVNQTLCNMVGYAREEVVGMTPMDLFGAERTDLERDYDAIIADNDASANKVEGHYRHRNGTLIPIETRRRAMRSENGWIIVGSARDITDQKQGEIRIRRLNRVYAVISGINALIVRARDRRELFQESCRVAADVGRFSRAWIGVVEPRSLRFDMAAAHGGDPQFFVQLAAAVSEKLSAGQGLVARALATRLPVVSNDFASDPEALMKDVAGQSGTRSLAILPLIVAGEAVGVFALNADVRDFFDADEMKLLSDLAGDIAHAIEHIDRAAKLKRTTRVNAMLSGINGAIARIRDVQGLFEEACRIAVETGGLTFAWLAVVDEAEGQLRSVASAGPAGGFLEMIRERLSLKDDAPYGHGLISSAVRQGRTLVANDVQTSADIKRKDQYAQRGISSAAALPLVIGGRTVGVFVLNSLVAGFFDEDEMKLLHEVAGNISFAMEHIDKEAKVQRLTRVYAVLSGVNKAIVRSRDRADLFSQICRIAVADGNFTVARVVSIDPDGRARIASTSEADPSVFLKVVEDHNADPLHSNNLLGQAIRSRRPLVSNDVAGDPRMPNRAELTKDGNYAVALLPIAMDQRVGGVIILRARETGAFDADEMYLLAELVSNVSFALELIEKREQLEYLAYHDVLTGLANRVLFHKRLAARIEHAREHGRILAVVLVDIERFKAINDSLGRRAGDDLLRDFGARLAGAPANADGIARIDADHFAVVVPETDSEAAIVSRIERRAAEVFETPFLVGGAEFRLSGKHGIALFPRDGADADTLFRNAEAALKKAKATGERHLFYTQDMNEKIAEKLALENQLRQALVRGEFVLHYQPKTSLVSGKLTGAEALIRWNDPHTGLVPPGRFIPVLEEIGLIYEVGRWALRQALADYLRWRAAGLPVVRIAVNVSPLQLRNRNFVAEIESVIGVDADAAAGLELEITESLIMDDIKHNTASLRAIRTLGVTVAIDDFGTGFSSLSYLAKLPVDTLKIDRSFVVDMTSGPEGLSLVSTIINLAHSLSLTVVAEGVETDEQARLLRLMRCDEMQGFLLSKPVAAAEFESRFLAAPVP